MVWLTSFLILSWLLGNRVSELVFDRNVFWGPSTVPVPSDSEPGVQRMFHSSSVSLYVLCWKIWLFYSLHVMVIFSWLVVGPSILCLQWLRRSLKIFPSVLVSGLSVMRLKNTKTRRHWKDTEWKQWVYKRISEIVPFFLWNPSSFS